MPPPSRVLLNPPAPRAWVQGRENTGIKVVGSDISAGLARQSVECVPPPTGAFFWIHTDHLGAPIAMSACGGQVLGARASGRESWAPGP